MPEGKSGEGEKVNVVKRLLLLVLLLVVVFAVVVVIVIVDVEKFSLLLKVCYCC